MTAQEITGDEHYGTIDASQEALTLVTDILLDYIEAQGVEYIFGVPGGPIVPFFEALVKRRGMRFVLARHEGGAAYMANSYAKARRGLGVCCVTSGPGATNALTGIAGASRDSLPVLYLTGQVATKAFGKGAIQESTWHGTDLVQVFRPVTKMSAMLLSADSAPSLIKHAIRTAVSGRPGPVHISMPADVIKQKLLYRREAKKSYVCQATRGFDADAVDRALKFLVEAENPCILAGGGVAAAGAEAELLRFAERLGAPVATSPKGKGSFPENHPLSLGVFGLGGHVHAHSFIGTHDVMLVVGSSLNEWSSSAWDQSLIASKSFIHIDIDPTEIGKNYHADVGLVGDATAILERFNAGFDGLGTPTLPKKNPLENIRRRFTRCEYTDETQRARGSFTPPQVVEVLRKEMPDDAMLFVDHGNSIMWAGHYWEARLPGTYWIDLGIASMGSATAGVIGGKLARPHQIAVALVGDAAFAMHGMEVHSAVELNLQVIWIVLNNAGHGMVNQGETLILGHDLGLSSFSKPLDVASIARGLGAHGEKSINADDFQRAFAEALQRQGPTVIDCIVDGSVMAPTLGRRTDALAKFFAAPSANHPPKNPQFD